MPAQRATKGKGKAQVKAEPDDAIKVEQDAEAATMTSRRRSKRLNEAAAAEETGRKPVVVIKRIKLDPSPAPSDTERQPRRDEGENVESAMRQRIHSKLYSKHCKQLSDLGLCSNQYSRLQLPPNPFLLLPSCRQLWQAQTRLVDVEPHAETILKEAFDAACECRLILTRRILQGVLDGIQILPDMDNYFPNEHLKAMPKLRDTSTQAKREEALKISDKLILTRSIFEIATNEDTKCRPLCARPASLGQLDARFESSEPAAPGVYRKPDVVIPDLQNQVSLPRLLGECVEHDLLCDLKNFDKFRTNLEQKLTTDWIQEYSNIVIVNKELFMTIHRMKSAMSMNPLHSWVTRGESHGCHGGGRPEPTYRCVSNCDYEASPNKVAATFLTRHYDEYAAKAAAGNKTLKQKQTLARKLIPHLLCEWPRESTECIIS